MSAGLSTPIVADAGMVAQVNAIADMEAALVQRVRQALTPAGAAHPIVDVASWPDKPDSYRVSHPVGAVLVVYQGSAVERAQGQLMPVQHTFALRLLTRTLRHPSTNTDQARAGSGTYQLLMACRLALTGWKPAADCDPMVVLRTGFADYVDGVWHHELTATTDSAWLVPVECPPGPWITEGPGMCCDTAPPLQRVDYADGQDAITPNLFIPTQPENMP